VGPWVVGPWVVALIYKASKLAFSDINRYRRLWPSPRSPCAGTATGLLKTPRTQLKNRQKWHSIDICLKHRSNKTDYSFYNCMRYRWAVSSEISDLCEVSDLLFFGSYFACRRKRAKFGDYFFGCVLYKLKLFV